MQLSEKERFVLQSLVNDFQKRGKKFGIIQTAKPATLSYQSFAGLVGQLKRKGIVKELKDGEFQPRSYYTLDLSAVEPLLD